MLEESRAMLSKANQALQTLEKYKEGPGDLSFNLTVRELEDLVTLFDVCSVYCKVDTLFHHNNKSRPGILFELNLKNKFSSAL